jgi:hypothetical protein
MFDGGNFGRSKISLGGKSKNVFAQDKKKFLEKNRRERELRHEKQRQTTAAQKLQKSFVARGRFGLKKEYASRRQQWDKRFGDIKKAGDLFKSRGPAGVKQFAGVLANAVNKWLLPELLFFFDPLDWSDKNERLPNLLELLTEGDFSTASVVIKSQSGSTTTGVIKSGLWVFDSEGIPPAAAAAGATSTTTSATSSSNATPSKDAKDAAPKAKTISREAREATDPSRRIDSSSIDKVRECNRWKRFLYLCMQFLHDTSADAEEEQNNSNTKKRKKTSDPEKTEVSQTS